jgi:predicted nucleotidyltransferase
MIYKPQLLDVIASQRNPLLFATISGAHLYGFPSPDSDFDLRGVHILPVREVIGINQPEETIEDTSMREGLEIDLVTHDIRKFFGLLLRRNGYVLEQLYSPHVVYTTPEHEELKEIADGCITRHHLHHYLGFANTQWRLFLKEQPRRVKPLLYVYRVLLTGIHLMETGQVEANLVTLNGEYRVPGIPELIERKITSHEHGTLADDEDAIHQRQFERLMESLKRAGERTSLPEMPSAREALNDLLIRCRLGDHA